MYKVILWGFGNCYNLMKNTIAYFEITKQLEVVCIAASDKYMEVLDDYRVIYPCDIREEEYDYIFVMSDKYFDDIVEIGTKKYGIDRKKMISFKILQIPQLNLKDYFTLYESDITIVSNNCWGGCIYNTLGMECQSPFKNLFLNDDDYIKVYSNLKYYMEKSLVMSHYAVDLHAGNEYPVLLLEDIEIHCNHADNVQQAIDDWERRKAKINWSNVYYEMSTNDKVMANKFLKTLDGKNGICFVPWKANEEKMLHIEQAPGQKYYWEAITGNATLGTYGLKYSLVDLLLGKKRLRY